MSVYLQKKSANLSNDSAPSDGASFGSSGIVKTFPFFWDCSPSFLSFSPSGYYSAVALALARGIWLQVQMPWFLHDRFWKCISKSRFPSLPSLKRRFKGLPLSPLRFKLCNFSACFLFKFVFSLLSSRLVTYAPPFPYDLHFHLCLMPMLSFPPPILFGG